MGARNIPPACFPGEWPTVPGEGVRGNAVESSDARRRCVESPAEGDDVLIGTIRAAQPGRPAGSQPPPSVGHDGAAMRPGLNILEPELIGRIVDEAKRVLGELGMEIRGPEMRRRLIEAGLPQRDDGRILFPRAGVAEAIRTAPEPF